MPRAARALGAFCDDRDGFIVEADEPGVFSPAVAHRSYAALALCGVANIKGALDAEAVARAKAVETEVREALEGGAGGFGLATAGANDPRVSGRGPNRFEVELPALDPALQNPSVIAGRKRRLLARVSL